MPTNNNINNSSNHTKKRKAREKNNVHDPLDNRFYSFLGNAANSSANVKLVSQASLTTTTTSTPPSPFSRDQTRSTQQQYSDKSNTSSSTTSASDGGAIPSSSSISSSSPLFNNNNNNHATKNSGVSNESVPTMKPCGSTGFASHWRIAPSSNNTSDNNNNSNSSSNTNSSSSANDNIRKRTIQRLMKGAAKKPKLTSRSSSSNIPSSNNNNMNNNMNNNNQSHNNTGSFHWQNKKIDTVRDPMSVGSLLDFDLNALNPMSCDGFLSNASGVISRSLPTNTNANANNNNNNNNTNTISNNTINTNTNNTNTIINTNNINNTNNTSVNFNNQQQSRYGSVVGVGQQQNQMPSLTRTAAAPPRTMNIPTAATATISSPTIRNINNNNNNNFHHNQTASFDKYHLSKVYAQMHKQLNEIFYTSAHHDRNNNDDDDDKTGRTVGESKHYFPEDYLEWYHKYFVFPNGDSFHPSAPRTALSSIITSSDSASPEISRPRSAKINGLLHCV